MWGFDSPAHLGLGRGEGVGRCGPAAALMERGGGAGTEEGRRRWLWRLGVWRSDARGGFYRPSRSVEQCGGGWPA